MNVHSVYYSQSQLNFYLLHRLSLTITIVQYIYKYNVTYNLKLRTAPALIIRVLKYNKTESLIEVVDLIWNVSIGHIIWLDNRHSNNQSIIDVCLYIGVKHYTWYTRKTSCALGRRSIYLISSACYMHYAMQLGEGVLRWSHEN